jgi:hypothetical protein
MIGLRPAQHGPQVVQAAAGVDPEADSAEPGNGEELLDDECAVRQQIGYAPAAAHAGLGEGLAQCADTLAELTERPHFSSGFDQGFCVAIASG